MAIWIFEVNLSENIMPKRHTAYLWYTGRHWCRHIDCIGSRVIYKSRGMFI